MSPVATVIPNDLLNPSLCSGHPLVYPLGSDHYLNHTAEQFEETGRTSLEVWGRSGDDTTNFRRARYSEDRALPPANGKLQRSSPPFVHRSSGNIPDPPRGRSGDGPPSIIDQRSTAAISDQQTTTATSHELMRSNVQQFFVRPGTTRGRLRDAPAREVKMFHVDQRKQRLFSMSDVSLKCRQRSRH